MLRTFYGRRISELDGEKGRHYFDIRSRPYSLYEWDGHFSTMRAFSRRLAHRFPSRNVLLGELWLNTVLAYQEGFLAFVEAGDWVAAALRTPAWSRLHLNDARLLLLYSCHDFVQGDWPTSLKRGVREPGRPI